MSAGFDHPPPIPTAPSPLTVISYWRQLIKRLTCLVVLAIVAVFVTIGCGGGGGDSSPPLVTSPVWDLKGTYSLTSVELCELNTGPGGYWERSTCTERVIADYPGYSGSMIIGDNSIVQKITTPNGTSTTTFLYVLKSYVPHDVAGQDWAAGLVTFTMGTASNDAWFNAILNNLDIISGYPYVPSFTVNGRPGQETDSWVKISD